MSERTLTGDIMDTGYDATVFYYFYNHPLAFVYFILYFFGMAMADGSYSYADKTGVEVLLDFGWWFLFFIIQCYIPTWIIGAIPRFFSHLILWVIVLPLVIYFFLGDLGPVMTTVYSTMQVENLLYIPIFFFELLEPFFLWSKENIIGRFIITGVFLLLIVGVYKIFHHEEDEVYKDEDEDNSDKKEYEEDFGKILT